MSAADSKVSGEDEIGVVMHDEVEVVVFWTSLCNFSLSCLIFVFSLIKFLLSDRNFEFSSINN